MYVRVCVCMQIFMLVYMSVCVYVSVHTCEFMNKSVCLYECIAYLYFVASARM